MATAPQFQEYNPSKLVKYGILVLVVREATTGYIGNMEIYILQKARTWKRPHFLSSTYGNMFTRMTIIIVMELQKSYS
jgi:hypothetical protein